MYTSGNRNMKVATDQMKVMKSKLAEDMEGVLDEARS